MKDRDLHDLIGGVLLTLLGVAVALYSRNYDFGTARAMGPGYFPFVLGWILAGAGVLIALPAWFRRGEPMTIRWKNALFVLGSIVTFALLLRVLGLALATFIAAFISTLADEEITWRGRLLVSLSVALVVGLIFIGGLSMVLPLWPWSS